MPTEYYRYDPQTGETLLVSGDATSVFEGDITTLTNGAADFRGPTIYDPATGRIISTSFGPVDITRNTSAGGKVVVTLTHDIEGASMNAESARLAAYNVNGDVTVMDHLGQERVMNISASSVTGLGQRMIVYKGDEGQNEYRAVTQGSDQEAEIQRIYGDTAKWASARQMTDAALIGYIGRNQGDLVSEIEHAGGMRDEFGALQTGGSGIVRALASIARGTLSFSKAIYINAAGAIGNPYG